MQKLPDAATLTPDQLVERWTVWLEETRREALHLYSSRYAFENIQQMFKTNPDLQSKGAHVYDWMLRNFYTEHLISIRKEMEPGGGFLTLVNFLKELEDYSEGVLTRQRYVSLYRDPTLVEHGLADKHFDGKSGAMSPYPKGAAAQDCISADSVRRTRETLLRENEKVVRFANWFIAHRTRQKPINLTLADMYKAVNRIFDTYATYYNVITGGVWTNRYPTPQFDWHVPFMFAWITAAFKEWVPPE